MATMRALVLCAVLSVAAGATRGEESDGKAAAVRDLIREMLNIKPSREPVRLPQPPKHMVDLYQQYSRRPPGDAFTTTIRNIVPSGEPQNVLMFDVSSVQSEEEVRLAQLLLNRRRINKRHQHSRRLLAPPYRIRLYRQAPGRLVPLASVPVSMVQKSSWEVVDVTAALRELLLDTRASRHLLAVRFESPVGKLITPSHFLRGVPHDPYAFLVVFTEDSEENAVAEDGGDPLPRPPMHTHSLVQKLQQSQHGHLFKNEEDNTPQIIPLLNKAKERSVYTRDNSSKSSLTASSHKKTLADHVESPNKYYTSEEKLLRKTRSIIDNQLPEDDTDAMELPKASPPSLMTPRTDVLRYPEVSGKKPKRGKKGKRKKVKKQKYLPSLESWDNVYQSLENVPGTCLVRKMTVNFAEIGWGEWVISPDKFDANYCTGSCRFPLTKVKL